MTACGVGGSDGSLLTGVASLFIAVVMEMASSVQRFSLPWKEMNYTTCKYRSVSILSGLAEGGGGGRRMCAYTLKMD